ncbi:hypothetical protein KUH03_21775 [Sphingobacterium sp. E70]|uniref:hypothetical protein n=1 Tax=Sphingobacterium sp. E70 TaxID=2853439 RepID=UPI00211BFAAD|nr:hypothetical protein [Sphingobacterium sp. E70]ULT22128.1 hypothetical protein KUH03_21775 [Sphingobacterium sp. E70]
MSDRFITSLKSRKWRWLYITLAVFLILVIAVGTYAYQKRDGMLMGAINKAKAKLLEKYDMDLKIQYYAFQGINAVQFKNIQLLPKNREPLAQINDLTVSVKLWPLLFGDVKLGKLFWTMQQCLWSRKTPLATTISCLRNKRRTQSRMIIRNRIWRHWRTVY